MPKDSAQFPTFIELHGFRPPVIRERLLGLSLRTLPPSFPVFPGPHFAAQPFGAPPFVASPWRGPFLPAAAAPAPPALPLPTYQPAAAAAQASAASRLAIAAITPAEAPPLAAKRRMTFADGTTPASHGGLPCLHNSPCASACRVEPRQRLSRPPRSCLGVRRLRGPAAAGRHAVVFSAVRLRRGARLSQSTRGLGCPAALLPDARLVPRLPGGQSS